MLKFEQIFLVRPVNVKKRVVRASLIIDTVVEIYLVYKKNERPHPRNSQNAF